MLHYIISRNFGWFIVAVVVVVVVVVVRCTCKAFERGACSLLDGPTTDRCGCHEHDDGVLFGVLLLLAAGGLVGLPKLESDF
jgi:hypothetical protein